MRVKVWTGNAIYPMADYFLNIEEKIDIGSIVSINFRNKEIFGIVAKVYSESEASLQNSTYKIKEAFLKNDFIFSENYMKFITQGSMISLNPLSIIAVNQIKMFTKNSNKIKDSKIEFISSEFISSELNEEQLAAVEVISSKIDIFVLWGVTGSGKTEVFFKIIEKYMAQNQQVLILLPEIAIIEGISQRFIDRFQREPTIWNSQSKNKKKFQEIISGESLIIIGSRSSLFIPFFNLGLIIVDEEHDSSYKQQNFPLYNARDLAVILGKISGISVILASATPSIETIYNIELKKYTPIFLRHRFQNISLPKINISINDKCSFFSPYILKQIQSEIDKDKQVIIFLNRRGFGPVVSCRACFKRLYCKSCFHPLNFHCSKKILLCHKCNAKYDHNFCFYCEELNCLIATGLGVEKIENKLKQSFSCPIEVFSSDTCNNPKKIKEFIERIKNKEIGIIVGTQIVAKGHNFPGVSLVVILNNFSSFLNFKSNETTFQTLVQVAGRAGRRESGSEVILQTDKFLDSNLINFFINQDYESFANFELNQRRLWSLPPFIKILSIKFLKTTNTLELISNFIVSIEKTNLFISISDPIAISNTHYYIILKITRENFQTHNKTLISILPLGAIIDVDFSSIS